MFIIFCCLQSKLELKFHEQTSLVALKWFKSSVHPERPSLAILCTNGKLQLMCSEQDDKPLVVDTELKPVDCCWSHDGTILAVAGRSGEGSQPGQNAVHLYLATGALLKVTKLPGTQVAGLSWEAFSQRLALAIDSYIYLAQVKHDYMWTCFSNTLVYHFTKPDKVESYVMFWDTKNNERYVKQVRQFVGTASHADHCVLATRLDDEEMQASTKCDFGYDFLNRKFCCFFLLQIFNFYPFLLN